MKNHITKTHLNMTPKKREGNPYQPVSCRLFIVLQILMLGTQHPNISFILDQKDMYFQQKKANLML